MRKDAACTVRSCVNVNGQKRRDMEQVIEKLPVISTLRAMEINEEVTFPIEQKVTLANTISSRMYKERKEGMRWTMKTDADNGTVTVIRLS